MEKEFIPYEQALALKELGFNEICLSRYWKEVLQIPSNAIWANPIGLSKEMDYVAAPLYQQAFRFFREEYRLDVRPSQNINKWWFTYGSIVSDKVYDTYEEAELACLKKLIEIVKKG